MIEIINYYDLQGNVIWSGDRKKVLKEQERISRKTLTWDVVKAILNEKISIPPENFSVRSIMIFLFDRHNNAYIIQRSQNKSENPGLWDKSVWGHVIEWDDFDSTAIRELSEELGVDGIIVKDQNEFSRLCQEEDLANTALLLGIWDFKNYISQRMTPEGDFWYKLFNVRLYLGRYYGTVVFPDGEAIGKKLIPLENLECEIGDNPDTYTYDILRLVQHFKLPDLVKNVFSGKQWQSPYDNPDV